MVETIELLSPSDLSDIQLFQRAHKAKVFRSRQLLARILNIEVGYLSFDNRPDLKIGVLYDLLVLPNHRCQGIGRSLVQAAENIALSLGYKRIRLCPRAFDGSVNQKWLESWYLHQDYLPCNDGTNEFEKKLV